MAVDGELIMDPVNPFLRALAFVLDRKSVV